MSHRYAHARQMKRARRCTRKLRTVLGRVIRDIERKAPAIDPQLRVLLDVAVRIQKQERGDKAKVYSVHEPQVECISKGKAHKRYEFGCKVSVAATSKGAAGSSGPRPCTATPMTGIHSTPRWSRWSGSQQHPTSPSLTWAIAATTTQEHAKCKWTNVDVETPPEAWGGG